MRQFTLSTLLVVCLTILIVGYLVLVLLGDRGAGLGNTVIEATATYPVGEDMERFGEGNGASRESASEGAITGWVESNVLQANQGITAFEGEVTFADGSPAVGVKVRCSSKPGTLLTDRQGRFTAELESRENHFFFLHESELDSYVSLRTGKLMKDRPDQEPRLVIAPRTQMRIIVLDEGGNPVPNAKVALDYSEVCAGIDLQGSHAARFAGMTDVNGEARLEAVPAIGPVVAMALIRDRWVTRWATLDQFSEVVLRSREMPEEETLILRGVIIAESTGDVVPDAYVRIGTQGTQADERGEFEFGVLPSKVLAGEALCAWKESVGAAVEELALRDAQRGGAEGLFFRLRLQPLRDIEGQVSWSDGTPCGSVEVRLMGGQVLQASVHPPPTLEGRFSPRVVSVGSDGRFAFRILGDREYSFEILDRDTLLRCTPDQTWEGDQVRLSVSEEGRPRSVELVVVDRRGGAIAEAEVMVRTVLSRGAGLTRHLEGAEVLTDRHGRFRLNSVSSLGTQLVVTGEDVIPSELPLREALAAGRIPVSRALKAIIRWESIGFERPTELAFLDVDDAEVLAVLRSPESTSVGKRLPFPKRNDSLRVEVGQETREIIGLRRGEVVARAPFRAQEGEVTIITLGDG